MAGIIMKDPLPGGGGITSVASSGPVVVTKPTTTGTSLLPSETWFIEVIIAVVIYLVISALVKKVL